MSLQLVTIFTDQSNISNIFIIPQTSLITYPVFCLLGKFWSNSGLCPEALLERNSSFIVEICQGHVIH